MSNIFKATDLPNISVSPALNKAISALAMKSDNEVKNRPAVEQSTVCTP